MLSVISLGPYVVVSSLHAANSVAETSFVLLIFLETPVGSPATWPVQLHIAFSIIHNSHIPAALYIDAKAQLTFWNDQYAQTIVRSKHPTLYGASGGEVYPEVEGISEMIGGVFREGTSYTQSAFQCFLRRIGTRFEEESVSTQRHRC